MKILLLLLGLVSFVFGECWWTAGCHMDSWAVVGCDQYGMDTVATEECTGGKKYRCCSKGTGNAEKSTTPGSIMTETEIPAVEEEEIDEEANKVLPSWEEFKNAVTLNKYPTPSEAQYNGFMKHAVRRGKISSKEEAAMALAQFIHESDGLQAKREYACMESNCPGSYATPRCDAPNQHYYGRGYIQLSWCYNYKPASFDIFGDDRLVRDPDQVARDESTAWATSFWFWGKNVHSRRGVQEGKFGITTKAINGGLECRGENSPNPTGAKKRFRLYGKVREAFGLLGAGDPSGCNSPSI